mgnify:CR=1 FL=1
MSGKINFVITPGRNLSGSIKVPGDKSISHRSIMLGSLSEGITKVSGFLSGEDTTATLRAFKEMGVLIDEHDPETLTIHGVGMYGLKAPKKPLDLGNSGTSVRLMSGLLSGQNFRVTLIGDQSLAGRPMKRVTKPLSLMGSNISTSDKGTIPIVIEPSDKLTGISYAMPVASAQIKSCLLFAGLYASGETWITEPSPSRDHTERMLEIFGYNLVKRNSKIGIIGGGKLIGTEIQIPSDISSAAFFIVGAIINKHSNLIIKNVGINPLRDGVLHILELMGAKIEVSNKRELNGEPIADISVHSSGLKGIRIPEKFVPTAIDEFPIIFIAAACAEGETILSGAAELRVKESDRIQAMADGLERLGISVIPTNDGIKIKGGKLRGGNINSYGDHRIAMAFAIAGIVSAGPVIVEDCDSVKTSFPNFVSLFRDCGLNLEIENG